MLGFIRMKTKTVIQKTNAARLLDRAGIDYKLVPYEVDEQNLAADHVASQLGEPIEQVFKTIVLHGDKTGHFVCIVAGNREVDLKKAAKASGNKKSELIPMKELFHVTGYIRGGCTALGMKKSSLSTSLKEPCHFPLYMSLPVNADCR